MVTERQLGDTIDIISRRIQEFDVEVYSLASHRVLSWDEFVRSLVFDGETSNQFRVHMYKTRYAFDAEESRRKLSHQMKKLLLDAH